MSFLSSVLNSLVAGARPEDAAGPEHRAGIVNVA
jgi:hypothetical protein